MRLAIPSAPPIPAVRAMILAAGRGERMRPLTDHTPKPLLQVHGKPLMQWPLDALLRAGISDIVVNTAWLGEQIEQYFGPAPAVTSQPPAASGERSGIRYSSEERDFGYALETAGGIARALPMLAPREQDVFWVAAGDIFAPHFSFTREAAQRFAASGKLAHLWLVPNPPHNPEGDFALGSDGLALNEAPFGSVRHTFSAIALYRRQLFEPPWCTVLPGNPQGTAAPLAPLLRKAIEAGHVSAEFYRGTWIDVGTPERLAQLNAGHT